MRSGPQNRRENPRLDFVDGIIPAVQAHETSSILSTAPFPLTLREIAVRFCFTDRRRELFEGLSRYQQAIAALPHPPIMQILTGSFLDDCEAPGDIDIANIVETVDIEAMPLYYDRPFTRRTFGIDASTLHLTGDAAKDSLSLFRLAIYYSGSRDGRQRATVLLRCKSLS